MSLFKDFLKDSDTLFKNEVALDPSFQPKELQFRENQQHYIAECIKPLFMKRNGKNLIIHGSPGIGKTVAIKHVLKELEEYEDDIFIVYVNCWKKNTAYQIVIDICEQVGYKFVQNKSADQLFKILTEKFNKKSLVICLDEVDKVEELDILYNILEDIYRKTILLITNEGGWVNKLDYRLKSRLVPEFLEFKPYNYNETLDILKKRVKLAFVPFVFDLNFLDLIAKKTHQLKDLRSGLFMLKEAGLIAENKSDAKVNEDHILEAIKKVKDFNKPVELDLDEKLIFSLIKKNPDKTHTELFEMYKEKGDKALRTFQRKVSNLEKSSLITMERVGKGKSFKLKENKKITDF